MKGLERLEMNVAIDIHLHPSHGVVFLSVPIRGLHPYLVLCRFTLDIIKLKRQIKQLKSVLDFLEPIKVAYTYTHTYRRYGWKSFNNNAEQYFLSP
jgi:hypothetical protein